MPVALCGNWLAFLYFCPAIGDRMVATKAATKESATKALATIANHFEVVFMSCLQGRIEDYPRN
jgi:hypothetical protein